MPDSTDERPDLTRLRTVRLGTRRHKVKVAQLGDPRAHSGVAAFVDALPDILAARTLRHVLGALRRARDGRRGIVWGLGAHVVKCGVTPYLTALMDAGYVTHLALNSAAVIHDFELALAGETSEDVAASIPDGSFGMGRETAEVLGALFSAPETAREGTASWVGRAIAGGREYPHADRSLVAHAHRRAIPASVHVALGADVLHSHPAFAWDAAARGARRDFDRFLTAVYSLDGGGVYLNVGSAVLLPEVFLKAVTVTRNLGRRLADFTTVVLDMIDHYRPRENVLARPGGTGLAIIGHHEILVPLIACALLERP
jgi:hypothetical protein